VTVLAGKGFRDFGISGFVVVVVVVVLFLLVGFCRVRRRRRRRRRFRGLTVWTKSLTQGPCPEPMLFSTSRWTCYLTVTGHCTFVPNGRRPDNRPWPLCSVSVCRCAWAELLLSTAKRNLGHPFRRPPATMPDERCLSGWPGADARSEVLLRNASLAADRAGPEPCFVGGDVRF
jgi:hypothetical protein